jgi:saccharopine dehydrogenase-like NADP-dependent oxidoreductase
MEVLYLQAGHQAMAVAPDFDCLAIVQLISNTDSHKPDVMNIIKTTFVKFIIERFQYGRLHDVFA